MKYQIANIGTAIRHSKLDIRNFSSGFSLVELLVICTVLIITAGALVIFIDPVEYRKKARDARRISDLGLIAQAIEQYVADNANTPPGAANTLRVSTTATNSANISKSDGSGWIPVDLSGYLERLPIDPINQGTHVYRYYRSGNLYKLDAKLEYYVERMTNASDGGTSDCRYEVGSGLATITIAGGC